MAAAADLDAFHSPQLLGQVLWQLLACDGVVPGHRMIFKNFVNLNNKFIYCLFLVYTYPLVWQHQGVLYKS